MRNKWFVGGILVPAVVCTWGTVACLQGPSWVLGIVPAALAVGLYAAAYKVSQAQSFSPQPQQRWDSGTSDAVKRWNDERDTKDAAKKSAAKTKV